MKIRVSYRDDYALEIAVIDQAPSATDALWDRIDDIAGDWIDCGVTVEIDLDAGTVRLVPVGEVDDE
jgi:hypothetical protein